MSKKSQTLLILAATLVIGIVIGALAGGALRHQRVTRLGEMRPEERFHRIMKRIIKPDDSQHKALQETLNQRYDQIAAIREECEDEIVAIYDSIHTDLLSTLTEEQRQRLERHLERAPKNMVEERVKRLTEELALDESQQAELKNIMLDTFKSRSGTHKLPHSGKGQRRARLREIDERIEAILTPEQLKQFQKMKQFRRGRFGPPEHPPFRRDGTPQELREERRERKRQR